MSLLDTVLETIGVIDTPSKIIESPSETFSGTAITPIKFGLPKEIDSICPECMEIIKATLYAEDGKVWISKTCPEHGDCKDVFYSNVDLYLKCEDFWFGDGEGVENPPIKNATICPSQCGLCNMHLSHSGLPIMDLTNRCNMTCPVCFANANAAGYLYEPTYDEVVRMLENLVDQKPVSARRVQFSGGEPTIRPDFLKIVAKAKELGFYYIQINTNGIKTSELEFAQALKEAGAQNLYLQFDSLSDEVYQKTRGRKSLLDYKLRTVENARKVKLDVILVPTMVKGYNDHQVGDIVRYAAKNHDVVSGIAFQPVSFVGRFSQSHRLERRYTLADLAFDIQRQTGYIDAMRDWFPIGCTTAFSKLAQALSGSPTLTFSMHPHCSQGTYFYIGQDGIPVPVSSFLDLKNFLGELIVLSRKIKPSRFELLSKARVAYKLMKHFKSDKAPKGLTFEKFLRSLDGYQDHNLRRIYSDNGQESSFDHFFVAGMHFMDAYNFSVERVMRCVIHYSDPKGHLYPFCAYNGAPVYRKRVEKRYMVSADLLKEKIIAEGRPKELEIVAKKMGIDG